jgi:hypothetical protein
MTLATKIAIFEEFSEQSINISLAYNMKHTIIEKIKNIVLVHGYGKISADKMNPTI